MANVELKNVKKIYQGNVTAVHDFNLSIKDKEFVVFVGPSGCGKSTTLRMIAGLEDITEGTVEIGGEVVNDLQPKDRGISMVFQNYALYPHLTVYENMAFPLRLIRPRMSNDEIFERVTNAAKVLGITQYLTRKPKALSGGQRQRVAIGRAMVRPSRVFLMDEPLSNLDAKLRNQMRAEIILLHQKLATTFIYVTHDQTEAMTLGDRIVIMKDGFIMQVGTPTEVFDRPENLFVAEFIGAPKMNTFPAKLEKKGDAYSVSAFGATYPFHGPKAKELAEADVDSGNVILGIRPEHLGVFFEPAAGRIPCVIEVTEMMGSEIHLHVRTTAVAPAALKKEDEEENALASTRGAALIARVATVSLTPEDKAALVVGGKVYLGFDEKVLHFFDPIKETNLIYGPHRINLLPTTIGEVGGKLVAQDGPIVLPVSAKGLKAGDKVIAGVYPEKVGLFFEAKPGLAPAKVVAKKLTSVGYYVHVEVDNKANAKAAPTTITSYFDPAAISKKDLVNLDVGKPVFVDFSKVDLNVVASFGNEHLLFAAKAPAPKAAPEAPKKAAA